MSPPLDMQWLSGEIDLPEVKAIVLMGSYARETAGPYSDIDILRFFSRPDDQKMPDSLPWEGTTLVDSFMVVVSTMRPGQVEEWFSEPEKACNIIAGLRQGKALIDRDGYFENIQERARDFVWGEEMQAKANTWASQQMVGWIEEVHKGLEGLRSIKAGIVDETTIGRMLHARFGLSWGLSRVMQVQLGVLVVSDNSFYQDVNMAAGLDSRWVKLREIAFGIGQGGDVVKEAPSLYDQVKAGLHFYVETACLLDNVLVGTDGEMVRQTVGLIKENIPMPGV